LPINNWEGEITMRMTKVTALAAGLVLVAFGATGCVSKGKYKTDVQQTDARLASMEDAIESNEKRIDDLGKSTDQKLAAVGQKADQAQQTGAKALQTAEGADKTATEAKRGRLIWNVTLSDDRTKFTVNGADLSADAKRVLDDLIAKIKGHGKAVYVEIEGHTDSSGSDDFNYRLGVKRAETVRNYLAKEGGVPLHAMNIVSYGESRPVADNGTRDGRAANRRVTVRVLD